MKKLFVVQRIIILGIFVQAGIFAANGILVVTNTNNSGAGSLRQAILDANSDPLVPHIIQFSIGSGVQTISPSSALPAITAPYTLIDGTTQPGWSAGNPVIVLSGGSLTPFTVDGLTISGAHNCVIRGLVINNGFNNGVVITDNATAAHHNAIIECFIGVNQAGTAASANNNGVMIIGDPSVNFFTNILNSVGSDIASEGNLISGNNNDGVAVVGNLAFTSIRNNLIGINKAGTSTIPNGNAGVSVIGSCTPADTEQSFGTIILNNVIGGNTVAGILLNTNTTNSLIRLNFIGVDSTCTILLPNGIGTLSAGVVPPDPSNPLNGAVSASVIALNTLSGNISHGIYFGANNLNNTIGANFIGTDATGTFTAIGNGGHGIFIEGILDAPSINNAIDSRNQGPNIIAYNGTSGGTHYGVLVGGNATTPDIMNPILGNYIFNNNNNGIQLQNNGNDLQAAPTVINAILNNDGNELTVSAIAPSTPASSFFRLEFFTNPIDRSPITEGKQFIGAIESVPSGETVVQMFTLPAHLSSNIWVSATATNLNNIGGQPGDTSPYSSNLQMITLSNNIPAIMFS